MASASCIVMTMIRLMAVLCLSGQSLSSPTRVPPHHVCDSTAVVVDRLPLVRVLLAASCPRCSESVQLLEVSWNSVKFVCVVLHTISHSRARIQGFTDGGRSWASPPHNSFTRQLQKLMPRGCSTAPVNIVPPLFLLFCVSSVFSTDTSFPCDVH